MAATRGSVVRAVLKKSAEKAATLSDGLALWPAVLLVLLGVSLSFGSFFALRAAEFSRAQAEFTGETDHWRMLFQQQLTHTIDGLGSVSALLESSEEVTRSEFRTFTGTIFAAHPEILSIEWLPKVTSEQRERFEARAQAEGLN